jgi:hypothetical protein
LVQNNFEKEVGNKTIQELPTFEEKKFENNKAVPIFRETVNYFSLSHNH